MDALFANEPGEDFEFSGFIYPKSRKSPIPQELIDNNIPQFDSLDEYYENNICSQIQLMGQSWKLLHPVGRRPSFDAEIDRVLALNEEQPS